MTGAGSGTPNPFYGLLCFYRCKPERSVWGESAFFGLLWFLSRILSKGGFPVEGDRPLLGRMEGGTAGGPFFVFRSLPVFGRRAAMPALFRFRGRPGRQRKPAGRPFPGRGGKNPPSGRRSHFPPGEKHPGAVQAAPREKGVSSVRLQACKSMHCKGGICGQSFLRKNTRTQAGRSVCRNFLCKNARTHERGFSGFRAACRAGPDSLFGGASPFHDLK